MSRRRGYRVAAEPIRRPLGNGLVAELYLWEPLPAKQPKPPPPATDLDPWLDCPWEDDPAAAERVQQMEAEALVSRGYRPTDDGPAAA